MGSLCHSLVKLIAEYFIFPFCDFIEWSREGGREGGRAGGLYSAVYRLAIRPFLMTRSGDRKVIIYDGTL